MKILFISPRFPEEIDGVGDYSCLLGTKLAENNVETAFFSSSTPHRLSAITTSDGKILPVFGTFQCWGKKSLAELEDVLNVFKPDIVFLQYVPHGYHRKGCPLFLLKLKKIVSRHHIQLWIMFHELFYPLAWKHFYLIPFTVLCRLIFITLVRQCDLAFTSIEYYRNKILHWKKNVFLFPIFSNLPLPTKQHNKGDGEFIVGVFGYWVWNNLAAVISKLRVEGTNVKLLLIGKCCNGPDYPYVEKTGLLPITDIADQLSRCDLLCLPMPKNFGVSFKSGSFAAALQLGIPILTCTGKATSPLLSDVVFFADPENMNELSLSLQNIIRDPRKRKKISDEEVFFYKKHLAIELRVNDLLFIVHKLPPRTFRKK